jgi:hypothetical protein
MYSPKPLLRPGGPVFSSLLTRIAQPEAGFDRRARRLAALENGKPAFPPSRGRGPRPEIARQRSRADDSSANFIGAWKRPLFAVLAKMC